MISDDVNKRNKNINYLFSLKSKLSESKNDIPKQTFLKF